MGKRIGNYFKCLYNSWKNYNIKLENKYFPHCAFCHILIRIDQLYRNIVIC